MSRILADTPILRLEAFTATTRSGPAEYYRLRMPEWANVVAVTEEDEVVLVRQHRWGIDAPTLEVPGGLVDPGEEPAQAALRELSEETGYGGGRLESLGWVWSNPAIQDNRTHMFLVCGVSQLESPKLDEGEDIDVVLTPATALRRLLHDGAIRHSLAVVPLQRFLMDRAFR